MTMITSPHNDKLKEVRKLSGRRERARTGRFVAEGEDLIAAADVAGWPADYRLVAADCGLKGEEVAPELLAGASELGSGTRAIAVYAARWCEAPVGSPCVFLDGVSDPGNVGAILRSADAFGAGSVVIGPRSADPYGPKAVRASMGSIFNVPVARFAIGDLDGVVVALDGEAAVELSTLIPDIAGRTSQQRVTLVIGSERDGLSSETRERADHLARIETRIHSLNAAMAATVALYELTRRMARA